MRETAYRSGARTATVGGSPWRVLFPVRLIRRSSRKEEITTTWSWTVFARARVRIAASDCFTVWAGFWTSSLGDEMPDGVSFTQSAATRVETARVGIRGGDGIGPPILQINQALEAAALRLPVVLLRDARPVSMTRRRRHTPRSDRPPPATRAFRPWRRRAIPMNRAEWSAGPAGFRPRHWKQTKNRLSIFAIVWNRFECYGPGHRPP